MSSLVRSGLSSNPPAFAHIGVTVPDLDEAVAWYRDVLGLDLLVGPTMVEADAGHAGVVAADVFGPDFGHFRQAHLGTGNGVAIELFEFPDVEQNRAGSDFEYWKTGCFHFCIVERDIDGIAERIARSGGRRRTRAWRLFPEADYRICYCEDPFGNIVEIYTHSHERTFASGRH